MALLDRVDERPEAAREPRGPRRRRLGRLDREGAPGRGQDHQHHQGGRRGRRTPRSLLILLLLTCATVITLDYRGGADSPVDPARRVVGEVLGPVEAAAAAALRPLGAVPDWFRSRDSLRADLARAEAESAELRSRLATVDLDRNRLAEYDALSRTASDAGYTLVTARVIAHGPGQSFSRTVTLDAGTRDGITADLSVVTADGLVGRVIRVTSSTATVLLVVDADSVVGGRLGRDLEVGFLRGRGRLGEDATLSMTLVDDRAVPAAGDAVLSWGSEGGAPYLSGIPIGRVAEVVTSPRQQTAQAVVVPFVDFSALDLVGVVVRGRDR